MFECVQVDLGERSYPILIGPEMIAQSGIHIDAALGQRRLLVVFDLTLEQFGHLDALKSSLEGAGHSAAYFGVAGGEQSKSFARLERLLEAMLAAGADRKSAVVAFGGGVVGDLAGFAAAILLRGVDLIQVPTTLLSQVDSSVGGKTGINSGTHGKNLIGSFHQPKLVLIDTNILDSLPPREVRAGYAEVIKYGCIVDEEFFNWLESCGQALLAGDADARRYAIKRACEIKAEVVGDDERELNGRRALLNFGHTFAHGYEALAGYGGVVLHGEAVSTGMTRAALLSASCGLASPDDANRLLNHLRALGLPVSPGDLRNEAFDPQAMLAVMRRDKKAESGALRFVLWRGIGRAFVCKDVADDKVVELLQFND